MKEAKNCSSMEEIREMIDLLDHQIVELVATRSQYVKEAAKFKKDANAVKDPARVQQVIQSKKELALKYGASPELVEKIYTLMIGHFIEEEMQEWKSHS